MKGNWSWFTLAKRTQFGFTLVEIMIVVAIIGLLTAIAIPNVMRARERTKEMLCKQRATECLHGLANADSESSWTIPVGAVDPNTWHIKENDGWVAGGKIKCPYGTRNYTFFKTENGYQVRCPNRTLHTAEWLGAHPDGLYSSDDE